MPTKHVFVETNWIVDCCAPQPFRVPEATELLKKAESGEVMLQLPGICLKEARNTIRKRFQPRNQLNPLRNYLRWAKSKGEINEQAEVAVRETFDQFEKQVVGELDKLEITLQEFANQPGITAFPLSEAMLERSLSLTYERLDLHPFDTVLLAAVLTRAADLKMREADSELFFCELDSDLQPWDKHGNVKPALKQLYDNARVWVYGDFAMTSHERPENWQR